MHRAVGNVMHKVMKYSIGALFTHSGQSEEKGNFSSTTIYSVIVGKGQFYYILKKNIAYNNLINLFIVLHFS